MAAAEAMPWLRKSYVSWKAERGKEILKWAITEHPVHEDASASLDQLLAGFYPQLQGFLSLIKPFIPKLY